ncbi:SLATT domain-containing protein [Halogeometricum borinquense]|uniref:SLATT domain-containing protein n=1 Tax=Halogeometricum borinquense TaxID=60847 RepID=A0A482T9S6_9EURY|nr:SLATT domain-containing protein [Halogeometricum borinquense]RYJ14684.1 SLATT domain-containing protein [Halogeometricum borinquense]
MGDDDFDYEAHERLRERVANEADSVLWTFKAYYVGADWYSKWDRRFDWAVFGIAGLLTIALIWDLTPQIILIALAITTAVISGYQRMANPGDTAENYYRAAHAYQQLFDDFRDFVKLELAQEKVGLEAMEDRYRELANRRRNLNEDMPEVTSKWYSELDDSIYDEVGSHEEAKDRLTGEAKLIDELPERDLDKTKKDRLTGSAKLEDEDAL